MGTTIITEESESHVIAVPEPVTTVIQATGSGGSSANYYRGIINYDGGHAGTHYGDLEHLDGGGAANGRRNPI